MEPSTWPGWLVLEALVIAHVAVLGGVALTVHAVLAIARRIRTRKEHP